MCLRCSGGYTFALIEVVHLFFFLLTCCYSVIFRFRFFVLFDFVSHNVTEPTHRQKKKVSSVLSTINYFLKSTKVH